MYGEILENIKGKILASVELVDVDDGGIDDWKTSYRKDMSQELRLTMSDGSVEVFGTMGDCCSVSWIEHLTVPKGLPSEITGIRELRMIPREGYGNKDDDPESGIMMHEHEYVQFYMALFGTQVGEVIVEYRNSSNGYYGGDMVHIRTEPAPVPV